METVSILPQSWLKVPRNCESAFCLIGSLWRNEENWFQNIYFSHSRLYLADLGDKVAMKDPEVYELGKLCKSDQAKQAQPTAATDAGRDDDKENHQAKIGSKEKTTVMLRNLPNNYTRQMFLQMLDENGLKGQYDFVYLPCDFYHDANLGYAFVNMVDASAVFLAWKAFQGFSDWSLPSVKVCQVMWSGPHQGFEAHVERYRNSPLMHQNVPDVFKPMIFRNGKRQPFPKPTKCLQAPFPFWDETNLTQKVQVFVRQCMIPQTDITKPLISMCIEHRGTRCT